jgi:hypothetical protein
MALLSDIKIMMLKGEKGDKGDGSYDDTEIRGLIQDEAIARAEDIAELEAHFLEYLYPIGSIFMSVNDTSPAVLFGGTWEKIEGRFLVGAGSIEGSSIASDGQTYRWAITHNLGDEIGSPVDHTIPDVTIDPIEIDSKHHHSIKATHATLASGSSYDGYIMDSSGSSSFSTDDAGNKTGSVQPTLHAYATPVLTQPQALVVNIWKRTA